MRLLLIAAIPNEVAVATGGPGFAGIFCHSLRARSTTKVFLGTEKTNEWIEHQAAEDHE